MYIINSNLLENFTNLEDGIVKKQTGFNDCFKDLMEQQLIQTVENKAKNDTNSLCKIGEDKSYFSEVIRNNHSKYNSTNICKTNCQIKVENDEIKIVNNQEASAMGNSVTNINNLESLYYKKDFKFYQEKNALQQFQVFNQNLVVNHLCQLQEMTNSIVTNSLKRKLYEFEKAKRVLKITSNNKSRFA